MDIKAWLNDKIEGAILGNLAKGLDAGKSGPRLQAIYRFGKGYATWTGAALALIFTAAAQFDNSGASVILAQLSAGLAGLGLVRKGAHMEPPQLPQEMRDALEAGLSIVSWLLLAMNGVVYLCQQLHASWAIGVSGDAQTVSLVLTAIAGFLATYVSDPKAAPAGQGGL